jgi:molecular chaperone DnaJ
VAAVRPDYYEVLGVPRDADEEAIRRAFHALARDCHPDVSDAPEDHERFRQLAEAYSVLSKPASRLLYDRYGYRGRGNPLFEEAGDEDEAPPRGENVHVRIELRESEARRGTAQLLQYDAPTVCDVCGGDGVIGEPDPECPDCDGTGQVREVSNLAAARILRIESCETCGVEPCDECEGSGVVDAERRLRVRIPPGVEEGDQVRVTGEGADAGANGIPGDLLLEIGIRAKAEDPPALRYLSLSGAILAAVLLVAYLFLG